MMHRSAHPFMNCNPSKQTDSRGHHQCAGVAEGLQNRIGGVDLLLLERIVAEYRFGEYV